MEIKEVIHKNSEPLKITLQRTKTGYNWEIHVTGKSLSEILPMIREANQKLKGEYSGKP